MVCGSLGSEIFENTLDNIALALYNFGAEPRKNGQNKSPTESYSVGLLNCACVQVLTNFYCSIQRLTGGTTRADCIDPKLHPLLPLGYWPGYVN